MSEDLDFFCCGRQWRLCRADLEALWDAMTDESDPRRVLWDEDERLPYWAELWPSSLALAEWLAEHEQEIAGLPCLDMGCGLGFTALVGQWLGARVTGMDYDADALRYARLNAAANNIDGVVWREMDWRYPTLEKGCMARIWAGDIMYERRFAAPVAAFMAHTLAPQGVAWLAEPGRTVFSALLEELPRHGLSFCRVYSDSVWPLTPQAVPVPVSIWEIRWC